VELWGALRISSLSYTISRESRGIYCEREGRYCVWGKREFVFISVFWDATERKKD
jgi:hypothetical protein